MTEIELHFSLSLTAKFKYYHSTFVSRPQLESDSKIWVKALSICTKKKKVLKEAFQFTRVHFSSVFGIMRPVEPKAQMFYCILIFNTVPHCSETQQLHIFDILL